MKKIFSIIFISLFLLISCDSASVPVKKSKTNICHKKGSKYHLDKLQTTFSVKNNHLRTILVQTFFLHA